MTTPPQVDLTPDHLARLLGQVLAEERHNQGLRQLDLTNQSGIAPNVIHRVEHGHHIPSLATLLRHATALGLPMHTLFQRANLLECNS